MKIFRSWKSKIESRKKKGGLKCLLEICKHAINTLLLA